ncbi:MAG: glutathione S-transferase [Solirubrobacterales bacterium]|nr:glutathione S-transferase [Solirubrobacterales bacterium]
MVPSRIAGCPFPGGPLGRTSQTGSGPVGRGRLAPLPAKLYVVHGSHPCNTVAKALELKGIAFRKVEIPPPGQVVAVRLMFPGRTVPAIRFEDGRKLQGSRAILAELDRLVPEPALLPADPAAAARVLEAERWGDEVLQPLARRILWPTLRDNASAAPSFGEGGQLPLPGAMLRASMPLIARLEIRINQATPAAVAADFAALPDYLARLDDWIADGTLGGGSPNRADLQIAPSIALLMTMQDLRDRIAARPCGRLADRHFTVGGHIPAGAIAPELLPA